MAQILDYARPEPRSREVLKRVAAAASLMVGLVVYAMLCVPAATQRGYPPIDHIWTGVTFLWPFPVIFFVLCCPSGRFSRIALTIYAIASGYVAACTEIMMVPHRFSFIEPVYISVVYVPIHLLGVGILAGGARIIFRRVERNAFPSIEFGSGLLRMAAFLVVLLLAIAFPFGYRQFALWQQDRAGRKLADSRWADHSAVIFSELGHSIDYDYANVRISRNFDPETGLSLYPDMGHGFERAYMIRIRELLSQHGIPEWSQKSRLVTDADMVQMLTSSEITTITTFPFQAAPGISLQRDKGTNDLFIETAHGETAYIGGNGRSSDTAYVARLDRYAGVIFVRCGQKWVAACTDDGWILGYAFTNTP